ncbi:TetR/AcrR family transcriptional regulator [Egbenema bharatensis]|uniref:TetR/AcrR family transcriptional regulator n=1 Tax=Egbenema bharatensis TaxID=3463334 RepID=UPI003A838934
MYDMKNITDASTDSGTATRPYRSSLRQKQSEATRQLILEALAEQLVSDGLQDFSIADAAKRAGVAARTIYRYFPNREAILEALGEWVDQQLGDLPYPSTPDEVAELAKLAFPRFEQQATIIKALLLSELGQNVRSRLRQKRRQAIVAALSPVMDTLSPEAAQAAQAVIGHLVTAETWKHLRDEFGVSGEAAGEAIAWAVRTLVADLQHQQD